MGSVFVCTEHTGRRVENSHDSASLSHKVGRYVGCRLKHPKDKSPTQRPRFFHTCRFQDAAKMEN